MKTVDVCGMSCPEPVLRLKNALKDNDGIELILDSKTAVENCENFAKRNKCSVEKKTEGDKFILYINKK